MNERWIASKFDYLIFGIMMKKNFNCQMVKLFLEELMEVVNL